MKQQLISFSRRYATALQSRLKDGENARSLTAIELGRRAVILGLETLELTRIHDRALGALKLVKNKKRMIKRAEFFFTEAMIPILENQQGARQGKIELKRLNETLIRRTAELASTNRQLQRGIVRRKAREAALKKSGKHYAILLNNSLKVQESLRQLAHRVLTAQEDERKKMSIKLQDEIAQTLLGINVRLLSLKEEAHQNTKGLKNEIARTQRLVAESAQSVRRAARRFRKI